MRTVMSLFVFIILAMSCQNVERTEKPDDLIPEKKMVDILTELSLLHAARNYNKNLLEETGLNPTTHLWNKYDIDSLQFVRSSDYYSENYKQYEKIYDQVKERLEVLKVTYDSIREEEERIQDSLDAREPVDSISAPKVRVRGDSLEIISDTSVTEIFNPNRMRKIDSIQ